MSNLENTKKILPQHYSKTDPYSVVLKEKVVLSHPNSSKKTYHISLDIKGSGLIFHPGDSIGVLAQNDPELIKRFLSLLHCPPERPVIDPRSQLEMTSQNYLLNKVNLSRVNTPLIRYIAEKNKNEELLLLLQTENKAALSEFLLGKDLIDIIELLQQEPLGLQDLAQYFTPLLPRFYSISSSLKTHPDELHLLVALLCYPHGDEIRYGVASHFLCHLATADTTPIPIYIQPAAHFKLPDDLAANIIMIGPGTGVAPYRAFLQERISDKATGKHWLFFGERNREYDFLYEDYLMDLVNQGHLRLDTAFSRDQDSKEYVQHKLLNHSEEIWNWISNGSYLYVCGDASRMAKDVEAALLSIIEKHGNLSEHDARAYLKQLRHSRRYMTDVY